MKSLEVKKVSRLAVSALALCGALDAVSVAQAQVVNNQAGVSAISPITQQVETGPVLDVVPYVLSDGYTINLTLIPSLTEFQGYQDPPPIPDVTAGLNVVLLPTSLPTFSIRQVVTTVNIWDNQTIVIGGLISSVTASTKDTVPMLGTLPYVGRLFQSSAKKVAKKNLMIFVTATIVDPAGNRVHSDDELPFTQSAIPTQPVVPGQTFEPGPAAAAAAPAAAAK